MSKRFGIDIDGTVTTPTAMLPFMNKAFNLKLTLDDIKQYDLTPLVNVSQSEFAKWFQENDHLIYQDSPLADGAKTILNQWEQKYELFFISARGAHHLELTKNWFSENSLSFHHIDLIGTHNKVQAAKDYKVDIFLEDKHDNAVMIHEECQIPVLLFNTPYNQDPIPEGVIRVNNWIEANHWVNMWLK